jgi:hypothetical protein
MATAENPVARRRMHRRTIILAVIVLVPCFLGFGTKFLEFLATYQGNSEGIFVLLPIINYLMATGGFCLLLVWATMQGMFRDVERPKFAMLEQESMLDEEEKHAGDDHENPPGEDDEEPLLPISPNGYGGRLNHRVNEHRGEPVCHV